MENFSEYLSTIKNQDNRTRVEEVLNWVTTEFPSLLHRIAWNQPMYTDHGTFIISFSVSKQHMAVAPERVTIEHFQSDIIKAGYDYSNEIIRIRWDKPVDYSLLEKIIRFNIIDKADCQTFWRK